MRVLFLNPLSLNGDIFMKDLRRCGSKSIADEIWPQTGLAYLASVLEQDKNDIMIIDAMAEKFSIQKLIQKIIEFNPKIIVANTTTATYTNDIKVIEILKKQINSYIGLIGPHVSKRPKESLYESAADFILIDEGEYTLKVLVKKVDSSWSNIKGLCYKKHGKVYFNDLREPIVNLDELPFPARHLLPNKKYTMPLTYGKPFAAIIPSRGCPYQCSFCLSGNILENRVRIRSVGNVIEEIKEIVNNLGINYIVFLTDIFTVNKRWVMDFCNEIIKNQINIKWFCNSRVDTIDEERLIKMKKAGCISISYGIESGSQKILDKSKKGATLEQSANAVRLTKKAGISVFAYFVIGLPGETRETINESINFAKKLDPDYVNFNIATPFPGTELYDIAHENNWLTSVDWEKFEQVSSAVIKTADLSPEDLIRARKKAMKAFYIRPKQILNQALKIRNFYDLKSRIRFGLKLIVKN